MIISYWITFARIIESNNDRVTVRVLTNNTVCAEYGILFIIDIKKVRNLKGKQNDMIIQGRVYGKVGYIRSDRSGLEVQYTPALPILVVLVRINLYARSFTIAEH